MRQLPETIDLMAFDWMRAQVLQYLLNPLARDGSLRLVYRLAPTHIPEIPAQPAEVAAMEAEQFRHLQSVRVFGYRPERVERMPYHDLMKYGGTDILVEFDADGNLVLVDGCHRILYLLVAGAMSIPARVRYRHPDWLALVRRADAIAGGYVYAELPHPDFLGCPTRRRENRVRKIADELQKLGLRSAVDLGCCSGAFACDLAAIVPQVHGIERDAAFVELARWRARRTGNAATFACGDLVEWGGSAELVSTLSVLHHVAIAHGIETLNEWLRGVRDRCAYLLVEYPAADEPILAGGGPARDVALDVEGWMSSLGFAFVHDFGVDDGFGKDVLGRRLLLMRGATIHSGS